MYINSYGIVILGSYSILNICNQRILHKNQLLPEDKTKLGTSCHQMKKIDAFYKSDLPTRIWEIFRNSLWVLNSGLSVDDSYIIKKLP